MKRSIGIKKILIGGIIAFVVVMLAVLWLCQVVFLDDFYHMIKKSDIQGSFEDVYRMVEKNRLDNSDLYELAMKNETCIEVMGVWDGELYSVATADVSPRCALHAFTSKSKQMLYQNALADGGEYLEYLAFDPVRMTYNPIGENALSEHRDLSLIYAVVKSVGTQTYMFVFNSSVTPISATVSTLYVLLSLFTVVILILSVVFAYFISRTVAKPIDRLTEKAARLGLGDPTVDFSVGGYSEVRQLSAALGYAAEEIRKTEELRRDFLANVTHDLKTPITLISGYGEMMLDFPEENNCKNIETIVGEAKRLGELVNEVLDYSKLVSGTAQLDIKDYCLTDQVKDICQRYAEMLKHDGFELTCEVSGDAMIHADPSLTARVLINYIVNAVNHTGDENKVIRVAQIVQGEWVSVYVTDNGKGIPAEELPGIWERYYKVGKNNSRTANGSGLGLSIVKTAMERMGGAYGVRSTVGTGSTFWFAFKILDI